MTPFALLAGVAAGATLRVAALHDTGALSAAAADCPEGDRVCRLVAWVEEAADRGAQLVVTPEYVLQLDDAAASPRVGAPLPTTHPLAPVAAAADRHDLSVVVALWTRQPDGRNRNAQVVLGPDGTVTAVHHKVELFDGEREWATPGTDMHVTEIEGHPVGLLICADLYAAPALHARLVDTLGARLVVVSAEWTAAGAPRWARAFAHDWGVPVAFANTGAGAGVGSGIYAAGGAALVERDAADTGLLIADVPLSAPPPPAPHPTPASTGN